MEENLELSWLKIQLYLGKPIYDYTHRKWRVLDGYKEEENFGKYITFTDTDKYYKFEEYKLYKEEQING